MKSKATKNYTKLQEERENTKHTKSKNWNRDPEKRVINKLKC